MKELIIFNPELPLIFDEMNSNGYFYESNCQSNHSNGKQYLPSLPHCIAWDVRNDLYSVIINPATIPSKQDKALIKDLLKQIEAINIQLNRFTEEEAKKQCDKQDINNVDLLRSFQEILNSYDMPIKKLGDELSVIQTQLNDILLGLNKAYLKALGKVSIEKQIQNAFAPLSYLKLPSVQIQRLINLWSKSHNVWQEYMLNNLVGDEITFFQIIS
jgi:hypothetical protein